MRAWAQACCDLVGAAGCVDATAVRVRDDFVGDGYSLPTDTMIEAVRMCARLEGLLLDPVYTGKAMAGLIGMVREGRFTAGQRVLFLHTGGAPSLYAYRDMLLG